MLKLPFFWTRRYQGGIAVLIFHRQNLTIYSLLKKAYIPQ